MVNDDHSRIDTPVELNDYPSCVNTSADQMKIQNIPRSDSGYSKQYFCQFCRKLVTKFARHIQSVHQKEKDVQNILNLPKGMFNCLKYFKVKHSVM